MRDNSDCDQPINAAIVRWLTQAVLRASTSSLINLAVRPRPRDKPPAARVTRVPMQVGSKAALT
jgi:hypothetical protein